MLIAEVYGLRSTTCRFVVGPLATIDGFDQSRSNYGSSAAGPSRSPDGIGGFSPPAPLGASLSASSSSVLPPLTPQDRSKYVNIFYNSGPENGVLTGALLSRRMRAKLIYHCLQLSELERCS